MRNVHCNVLTSMRQCHVMCHAGVWHCHGLTSAPPTLTSSHYWLQMSDDHCHTHTLIVKLAYTDRGGYLRNALTVLCDNLHKVNFTILWDQRNVRVQYTLVGKTYYILTFNFHTSNPETAWICDTFSCFVIPSLSPVLHRVSDVTIMQYCHIGSDASSSQPTRRNEKDNQVFFLEYRVYKKNLN